MTLEHGQARISRTPAPPSPRQCNHETRPRLDPRAHCGRTLLEHAVRETRVRRRPHVLPARHGRRLRQECTVIQYYCQSCDESFTRAECDEIEHDEDGCAL